MDPDTLAFTVVNEVPFAVADVRLLLLALAKIDDEPNSELLLYDAIPGSMTVNYGVFNVLVENVRVPTAINQKWFAPAPVEPDMNIVINSDALFDYDNGDCIDGGTDDFEATVLHEILHGLGFDSFLDAGELANDIRLHDVFRLRLSAVGTHVTRQEFTQAVRNLAPGEAAVSVLFDGANNTAPMSTGLQGDGFGAPHWKQRDLNNGVYVGLMDPQSADELDVPGYLSQTDIQAMDIIGWNIGPDSLPLPPERPQLQQPADGQKQSSPTPTLMWASVPGASIVHVLVFGGTVIHSQFEVFEARDLTVSSVTVPSGTLEPGTTYTWVVIAENSVGLAYSARWTFTTEGGCPADWDGNGTVNSNDYFAFLADYNAGDADFDGDGDTDSNDYFGFLDAYFAGC